MSKKVENLDTYKVMALSQGSAYCVMEGTYKECRQFCDDSNWEIYDENEFCWGLEIL